jgi:hypothetical protein
VLPLTKMEPSSPMSPEQPDSRIPTGPKRREDTADGCRSMARDDRTRAEETNNGRMRFQLACSAEAWTSRADLLDRLEANRAQMEGEQGSPKPKLNDNKEISDG